MFNFVDIEFSKTILAFRKEKKRKISKSTSKLICFFSQFMKKGSNY